MSGTKQGRYVTRETCEHTTAEMLAGQQKIPDKLESIEQRLFHDNGTLSIQTRIERHDQILKVLLWASSIVVGTVLTAAVTGVILAVKWALAHGGAS